MSEIFYKPKNTYDSPEQKLSTKERETIEYIEKNKQSIEEALSLLLSKSRFILVGEAHLAEAEPLRKEVSAALRRLQQEGLTHLALEANKDFQKIIDDLDFSDKNILEILKQKCAAIVGWGDGNFNILIQAKKLGLKVVLINFDDGRPDAQRDSARWQNTRDSQMLQTLNDQVDENAKVLIFIGNDHVHKGEVSGYSDGKVKPLGMRLVEQYGDNQVKSVRYVGRTTNFDNLLGFMSQTPTPNRISVGATETVILPDEGPLKGDPRVSAADFIVTRIGKE